MVRHHRVKCLVVKEQIDASGIVRQLLVDRLLQRCLVLNQDSKVVQRIETIQTIWLTDYACLLQPNRCVMAASEARPFSDYLTDPEMDRSAVVFERSKMTVLAANIEHAVVALELGLVLTLYLVSIGQYNEMYELRTGFLRWSIAVCYTQQI